MTQAAPAAAKPPAAAPPKPDPREARAQPVPLRFALVLGQLLVLAAAVWRFAPVFFPFAAVVVACFAIHYWTPFRFKEPVWLLAFVIGGGAVMGMKGGMVAGGGGGIVAGVEVAALVVLAGVVIHRIVSAGLPFWGRVALVAAVFGAVLAAGAWFRAELPLPPRFYRAFGVVFMLNIFVYLRDAQHAKKPATFMEFARAFFVLPSLRVNAPFLDMGKVGQSFYRRDTHQIAQQGIGFLVVGAIQYAACEILSNRVYYATAGDERTPLLVLKHLVCVYSFYFHTSGSLNMYVGVMNLFGYDMPECYRWFVLSHSPLDFWRRANIYYKDAMTKVVYMPLYFALRKRGEVLAKVAGIFVVFVCSWAIHVWVMAFFSDLRRSVWAMIVDRPMEAVFWISMGAAAVLDMLLEAVREQRGQKTAATRRLPPAKTAPWTERARHYVVDRVGLPQGMHPVRGAIQIAAMQIFIACLFSLQHAPNLRAWANTLRFWN